MIMNEYSQCVTMRRDPRNKLIMLLALDTSGQSCRRVSCLNLLLYVRSKNGVVTPRRATVLIRRDTEIHLRREDDTVTIEESHVCL